MALHKAVAATQVFEAVTQIEPATCVEEKFTAMLVVPCPETSVAPAGMVHK